MADSLKNKFGYLYSHHNGHYYDLKDVFVIGNNAERTDLCIDDNLFSDQQIRILVRESVQHPIKYYIENVAKIDKQLIVNAKIIPQMFYFEIPFNSLIKVENYFFILCEKRLPLSMIESLIENSKVQTAIPFDNNVISKAINLKKELIADKARLSDLNRVISSNSADDCEVVFQKYNSKILNLELQIAQLQKEKADFALSVQQSKFNNFHILTKRKNEIIVRIQDCESKISSLLSKAYSYNQEIIEFSAR